MPSEPNATATLVTNQAITDSDSATVPHPQSELEQRLHEHPSQRHIIQQLMGSSQAQATTDPCDLALTLQDLVIDDLPSTTRFAILPSETLADSLSKEELAPIHCPNIPGDVYIIAQTSESAWFSFVSQRLQFQLFYDPASDNLIFVNGSQLFLTVEPLHTDSTIDVTNGKVAGPRYRIEVGPGPWRVSASIRGKSTALCDFLILRRRYSAEIRPSVTTAGSKRKLAFPDQGREKRLLGDDQSLVLINTVPVKGSKRARFAISKDGNTMHEVQPGHTLQVQVRHSQNEGSQGNATTYTTSSEVYSISNMRDIVTTTAASIFYGKHSLHGLVAVKCLRQRQLDIQPAVPTFARYWEREKRLLQSVNHPSIIRYMAADARFFSIYMEYLPFPDLTGSMKRPENLFTGSLQDAIRIMQDMLSALHYLSQVNIVHNDIKPGNILYDATRGAVLIDFGLAGSPDDACSGGTPWYVPREAVSKKQRKFDTDIYALGVTSLYLLKKSPLPELQGPMWIIAEAPTNSVEEDKMEAWLGKVVGMQKQLGMKGSEVELVVRDMVDDNPGKRGSAQQLLQRLQGL